MTPLNDSGTELDAKFFVETTPDGAYLILESHGGPREGPKARNRDYVQAFELLVRRLGRFGARIRYIEVYSRTALQDTPDFEQRRLIIPSFTFPLKLTEPDQIERFRKQVASASAHSGRDGRGGNGRKRLRFTLDWPSAERLAANDLERMLAGRLVASEEPTSDPTELEVRADQIVRSLRSRGRSLPSSPPLPPPPAGRPSLESTVVERYLRDPRVVAWVRAQAGNNCEACGAPAPFLTLDGEPFLEVHHVRPLSSGGPDQVDNAVAVCPNCHRRLHHSQDRESFRASTIARVRRLVDHPAARMAF